ncbi:MAG: hypothetical protein K940chlam1_00475 [Candidatus Anoxychlamydiales bacterium]|nr:hypothetical protein [Candidatus Anoxychlamydiales bacterium]NGX35615.1 hypothetical protein [Candidatus Anoxychlamydiales bacterium]
MFSTLTGIYQWLWPSNDVSSGALEPTEKKTDQETNNLIIFFNRIARFLDENEIVFYDYPLMIEYLERKLENKQEKLLKITNLDLSNLGLSKIPQEISYLKNLRELNLSNNNLYVISQEVFSLTKLEKLLASNCILDTIESDIVRLKNLKYIDFSSNEIRFISDKVHIFLNQLDNGVY